jgi:hypothetical protein
MHGQDDKKNPTQGSDCFANVAARLVLGSTITMFPFQNGWGGFLSGSLLFPSPPNWICHNNPANMLSNDHTLQYHDGTPQTTFTGDHIVVSTAAQIPDFSTQMTHFATLKPTRQGICVLEPFF